MTRRINAAPIKLPNRLPKNSEVLNNPPRNPEPIDAADATIFATTVTDVAGFFSLLGLAYLFIRYFHLLR